MAAMKISKFISVLIISVVCLTLTIGCTTAPSTPATQSPVPTSSSAPTASQVVWKASFYAPATNYYYKMFSNYAERILKATQDRVKLEIYPGATLTPVKEELSAVKMNTVDFILSIPTYFTGQIPLLNAYALPWVSPPTDAQLIKFNTEMIPALQNEFTKFNVHLLMSNSNPAGTNVMVTTKPVKVPSDCKGLKIRTAGGYTDQMVVNWGAGVVSMAAGDVYTALQRGTVDGTLSSMGSIRSLKYTEVAKYVINFDMGFIGFVTGVNQGKWDAISAADKKAISDITPEFAQYFIDESNKGNESERKLAISEGTTFYDPDPATLLLWKDTVKDIYQKFAATSADHKTIADIIAKNGGGPN